MGKQRSGVKQSCCKCTMKVSKRSTAFSVSCSSGHFFFRSSFMLDMCCVWIVARKPLQRSDVYLPSRPPRTHCTWAWLVVMDPFNSTPQRRRLNKGLENTLSGSGFPTVYSVGLLQVNVLCVHCIEWVNIWSWYFDSLGRVTCRSGLSHFLETG